MKTIPIERVRALIAQAGSVDLNIDGNCAYALLGPDLQAGEAVFVKIEVDKEHVDYDHHASVATVKALRELTLACYPDGKHSLPYNVCKHPTMGRD